MSRKPDLCNAPIAGISDVKYIGNMMHSNTMYHMFNRGNQKQTIFLRDYNYAYFIEKMKNIFCNDVDLLAYCLMPNHFHFMIMTGQNFNYDLFSKHFGKMLSSYTRGIQLQEKFVGSLFQQNTKKKALPELQDAFNCFQYIHQNPLKANLAKHLDEWPYSSFREYLGRNGICNIKLGRQLLDLPPQRELFVEQSISAIRND